MGSAGPAAQFAKGRKGTARRIGAVVVQSGVSVPDSNWDQTLQRKV